MKTIKNKIVLNYSIVVVLTVFSLEVAFILFAQNYYHSTIKNYLFSRATTVNEIYNDKMPHKNFNDKAREIYRDIILTDEKSRVQIIDINGAILVDSAGVRLNEISSAADVYESLEKGDISFRDDIVTEHEKIYAISVPIKDYYNRTKGVVRFSVSLEKIGVAINNIMIICIVLGILVLLLILTLSLILAKSIVVPIQELKNATEQMASGNYKVRASKITEDEIGDLAETFNYMAEEIDKSEKIKNDFISSISHELRTPLTSIQGWSETLMIEDDEEDRKLGLSIIESETKRLINLVEDLLDFSRYQKNTFSFDMNNVDIIKLITDVVNQYKVKANEKKIKLTLNIKDKTRIIWGDQARLKQVMINLLENAYKFTDYNGNISVNAYSEDDKFKIEVLDDGIGIDKENLNKIFKKFFKVDANKPGSGIGLALCYEIVKRHNGEINVESEKGEGTKFTITL
ncbi:sensor histidine kinase [Oceanirhabdus sp. W0125-5]|uniref:sensor histidine kinase n=1 Tax=Oceanirhabdus sp. W0125-5 TaxID=2999116 RepID=UPI0022F2D7DE|nr:HAMP domain-containing sensor histidine kinase [Oceanirhabdus sp. W0125-5]WBW99333.1 HAMP domain-containing sensor histidine kinase [Oceanirhabdus sp. W0125-5]